MTRRTASPLVVHVFDGADGAGPHLGRAVYDLLTRPWRTAVGRGLGVPVRLWSAPGAYAEGERVVLVRRSADGVDRTWRADRAQGFAGPREDGDAVVVELGAGPLSEGQQARLLRACLTQLHKGALPLVVDGAVDGLEEELGELFQVGGSSVEASPMYLLRLQREPDASQTTTLLTAARHGAPVLVIDQRPLGARQLPVLDQAVVLRGEPSVAQVAHTLLAEAVLHLGFLARAERLIGEVPAGVRVRVRSRPPAALSMPGADEPAELVLHPSPPLHGGLRDLLLGGRPGVRLATPEAIYGDLLAKPSETLAGWRIGVSTSSTADGQSGADTAHLVDALVALGRTVMTLGAQVVYGGDSVRRDSEEPNYTHLLADVVLDHDATGAAPWPRLLHVDPSAGSAPPAAAATDVVKVPLAPKLIGASDPALEQRRMDALRGTLELELGRAVGSASVFASGKTEGSGGVVSGLVHELWLALRAGRPVFLLGGFGGKTRALVELVRQGPDNVEVAVPAVPSVLAVGWSAAEARGRLDSTEPEALQAQIRAMAGWRASDPDALWSNGLSYAENEQLFTEIDPDAICGLVARGLRRLRLGGAGAAAASVVAADLAQVAQAVDAVLLPLVHGLPLRDGLGGVTQPLSREVAALYDAGQFGAGGVQMHLTGAGPVVVSAPVAEGTGSDALQGWWTEALSACAAQGLRRVACVRLPGDPDGHALAAALSAGGARLARLTLTVCTPSASDTKRVHDALTAAGVRLVAAAPVAAVEGSVQRFALTLDAVALSQATVSWLEPDGTALVPSNPGVDLATVGQEMEALRVKLGAVPPVPGVTFRTLQRCADSAARAIGQRWFAKLVDDLEASPGQAFSVEVHTDAVTDQLGVELIGSGATWRPPLALRVPVVRRRRVREKEGRTFRPPRQSGGPLRVLVVADPTSTELRPEAELTRYALERLPDVNVRVVSPLNAVLTAKVIVAEIEAFRPDVLHLIGHGLGGERPAFAAAGGTRLEEGLIKGASHVPRLVVLNQCESVRVDPNAPTEALAGLAGSWLDAGVASLIGTRGPVRDADATVFGVVLIGAIAAGRSVGEAVLAARQAVAARGSSDWFAWAQYGGAEMVLLPDPLGLAGQTVDLSGPALPFLHRRLTALKLSEDPRQIIVITPHLNAMKYATVHEPNGTLLGYVLARGDASTWSQERWVLSAGGLGTLPDEYRISLLAEPKEPDEEDPQGPVVDVDWDVIGANRTIPAVSHRWEVRGVIGGVLQAPCAFYVQESGVAKRHLVGDWSGPYDGLAFKKPASDSAFDAAFAAYVANSANVNKAWWTETL